MSRHIFPTGRHGSALLTLVGALVLAANGPALASDRVSGEVGLYRMFDSRSDPSVLCAYPDRSPTTLAMLVVRGPRVDFPYSIGEVGVVRWTVEAQRSVDDGPWRTIDRSRQEMAVTVGRTETFETAVLRLEPPPGRALIRVSSRLTWFAQPGPPSTSPSGSARHTMRHYAWTLYGPDDPARFDDIERRSVEACDQRWRP